MHNHVYRVPVHLLCVCSRAVYGCLMLLCIYCVCSHVIYVCLMFLCIHCVSVLVQSMGVSCSCAFIVCLFSCAVYSCLFSCSIYISILVESIHVWCSCAFIVCLFSCNVCVYSVLVHSLRVCFHAVYVCIVFLCSLFESVLVQYIYPFSSSLCMCLFLCCARASVLTLCIYACSVQFKCLFSGNLWLCVYSWVIYVRLSRMCIHSHAEYLPALSFFILLPNIL